MMTGLGWCFPAFEGREPSLTWVIGAQYSVTWRITMFSERFSLPQALLDYYNRVSAEVLNFKRAVIRGGEGKYKSDRAVIKVLQDGSLEVSVKDHRLRKEDVEPTEEEQTLISQQWALCSKDYPRCIQAEPAAARRQVQDSENALRDRGAREVLSHVFHDRTTGKVAMILQRWYCDHGARHFTPHTFWSDGCWRTMEPEGKLPFWKPEVGRKARIMVHEGAKAAQAAERVALDRESDHPWRAFLARYEHWGMIGGALSPHRTNFDELRREKPEEVIYVCDNDWPGKEALQKVSRLYGFPLKGVVLDSRWPLGWDMADDMPEEMFAHGRWVGPELEAMVKPATHATQRVLRPGTLKFTSVVSTEFAREWFHSAVPEVFVHRDWPNKVWTAQQFNNLMAPFSDIRNLALKVQENDASKGVRLTYTPALDPGIHNGDGGEGLLLNTHVPSRIKPCRGDARPFLDYVEHLVPGEEDRRELLRWIVTLVARPEVKMLYGLLLISENQGVGKSTLGERILAPLVGKDNVSFPSETDIVDSNYNYWCSHKRLAVVHEIYAGHSSKAYDKLKSLVTDRELTVSMKYLAPYTIENWVHVFACSNSKGALRLSQDDRRWFVPKVTDDPHSLGFWQTFNAWLEKEGGLGIIKAWCLEQADLDPKMVVPRGAVAPMSDAKKEVIQEGYSEAMRVTFQLMSEIKDDVEKAEKEGDDRIRVVWDTELVSMVKAKIYKGKTQYLERPLTLRKVARSAGWMVGENQLTWKNWSIFKARPLLIGKGASKVLSASANDLVEMKSKEKLEILNAVAELESRNILPFIKEERRDERGDSRN